MSSTFPASFIDNGGVVRLEGEVEFTDPSQQPGSPPPFKPTAGNDVIVVEDHTGAHQLLTAGEDTAGCQLSSLDGLEHFDCSNGGTRHLGAQLGFYNASPVTQQVVPLTTPSVQNVIDALLALGLVVQHD